MQGNKKVLIAAVLLLLISVSFTTYAIYQSAVNVNTSVNAARWNVVFKKDSSTPIVESETITLTSADCPGNSHVAAGVIAPGATCTKTIILDAGNSQVDVTYTATAGPVTVGGDTVEGFTASLSPASGQILNGSETRTAESCRYRTTR